MDLMQWNWWLNSGGGGSPTPESLWGADGDNSLVMHLDPSNSYTLYKGYQPESVAFPYGYSENDGDPVTYMITSGYNANSFSCTDSPISRSPLLGSDPTYKSFLNFGNPNTIKYLQCNNSLMDFKGFWKPSPSFSTILILKKEVDGTNQIIANNTNNVTTNAGIEVSFNSNNTFTMLARPGGSAGTVWTITTVQTITVADGWVAIGISINGSGASKGTLTLLKGGVKFQQTFNVGTDDLLGSDTNAPFALRIGTRNTVGTFYTGKLARWIIRDVPGTDQDFEYITSYNRNRGLYKIWTEIALFETTDNCYSDLLTTPAVNGDPVQSFLDKTVRSFSDTKRYFLQADEVNRPIYIASDPEFNNLPTLEFTGLDKTANPGVNSNMDQVNQCFPHHHATSITMVFVFHMKKDSTQGGGGYLACGSSAGYVVITGTKYGNPPPENRSFAQFHWTQNNICPQIYLPNQGGKNIIVYQYNQTEGVTRGWDGNGVKYEGGLNQIQQAIPMTRFADTWRPAAQGWFMHGTIPYFRSMYGEMPEAKVQELISALRTKYDVPIGDYVN